MVTLVYDMVLIWNPVDVPDFDHYNIYRVVGATPTLIGQSNKPAYIDKDMPEGFAYVYYVTAVDKLGNESAFSLPITKTSPPEFTAPLQPTQLKTNRTGSLQGVELNWEENVNPFATPIPEKDIKGYLVYRVSMDNPGGTIVQGELISIQSSNKFVDSSIPLSIDTHYKMTWVYYIVYAYDKYFNYSTGISSAVLPIPTASSLRGIVDYLSINLYWELPVPEKAPVSLIYPIVFISGTWYRGAYLDSSLAPHQTVSAYPGNVGRMDGYLNAGGTFVPFVKGTSYFISVSLDQGTHGALHPQEGGILVEIPDYEQDTTVPTRVQEIQLAIDTKLDIGYLTWARDVIDDDLMYYEIAYQYQVSPSAYMVHGTTTQNFYQLRELSSLKRNTDQQIQLRVTPVDRSGNRGYGATEIFALDIHPSPGGQFNYSLCSSCTAVRAKVIGIYASTVYDAKYTRMDINWRSSDCLRKEFKMYVIFMWDPDNDTIDYLDANFIVGTASVGHIGSLALYDSGGWASGTKRKINIGVLDILNVIHINTSDAFDYVVP